MRKALSAFSPSRPGMNWSSSSSSAAPCRLPLLKFQPGWWVMRKDIWGNLSPEPPAVNSSRKPDTRRSPWSCSSPRPPRQAALQGWLDQVTQRPQLWCDELQQFLSLAPPPGARGAQAPPGGASAVEAPPAEELAELQWIASRMGSAQGGVARQGDGTARGDAIVRWLLAQALAGSQEQAVTLADAMRRQGLLLPATKMVKFVGSASASYRLSQDVARHSAPP